MESENEVEDMDDGESGLSEDDDDNEREEDREEPTNEADSSDDDQDMEEDSSDMDAGECEKKRVEYIDDLTDLEKQFAILREQ